MLALVVDDSKPIRSIVAQTLRSLRFDCLEAANGVEALEVLAKCKRPDLVMVNWHMPVMDGIELIRQLRQHPTHRSLRLLMISTEHDTDKIATAKRAGADDYLAKPFTPDSLTRTLIGMRVCREADVPAESRRQIRVLIVDDSATIRAILSATLATDPDLKVVGAVMDGQAAVAAVAAAPPDIVLLDVEMPVMDGITALREIRKLQPKLPVVMFSSLTERGARATLDALLAGANDYVAKPAGQNPAEVADRIRTEVISRIKALVPRLLPAAGLGVVGQASTSRTVPAARTAIREPLCGVVIGVSTGGPSALAEMLPVFAVGSRVPILIVQHMPASFTAQLAERLGRICGVPVKEAITGQAVGPGDILLAPGGQHMAIERDGSGDRVRLTNDPPENSCRPSADVLFRSAAKLWGGGTLGLVLTGMGRDGLAGSRAIVEAGGEVIAQDEFSSVVWGMPGEVVRAGLAAAVLPLSQIGVEVALRLKRRGR